MPILRGTAGLWKAFPKLRQELVTFEEFVKEDFFKNRPDKFWYVYGDIHNKLRRIETPHSGYEKLLDIIEMTGKMEEDSYFVYHGGVDDLYKQAGFPLAN